MHFDRRVPSLPFLFLSIVLASTYAAAAAPEPRIVCYYTNWSVYRLPSTPILFPDEIDPSVCTHVHVAFALINPTTLKIEPSEKHDTHYTDVFSTPLYIRLRNLRTRSSIKVLVAVGGWTAASEAFNNVLANASTRALFIRQAKMFVRDWNFDGIDLDWEFPGDKKRGAANNSREEFNVLIKEMYESFHNDTQPLLLTAAVTADPTKVNNGYVVHDFCQYLDYVGVMTYDYYGAWDNVTGINAPLYGSDTLEDNDGHWKNVNNSIRHWITGGCPAEKLNMGLALYGRSFTLTNDSDTFSVGTESIGSGLAGPFTKENGTLAYFEVCQKLRAFNWTRVFDTDAQAPYAYSPPSTASDRQWVGYDDLKSITVKVLFAKALNLGGVMLWSLDQDDYTGIFCGQGQFPIARRVRDSLFETAKADEQTSLPSTKMRTKQPVTALSPLRLTSPRQRSTSTFTSDAKGKNAGVGKNNSDLSRLFLLGLLLSLFR